MARVSIRMDERSVREFGRRILRLVSAAPARDLPLDRLVVKSGGSTRFVRVADIDWIEVPGFMRTCTSEERSCCTGPR
jgi:two-component system LytT family response regulator